MGRHIDKSRTRRDGVRVLPGCGLPGSDLHAVPAAQGVILRHECDCSFRVPVNIGVARVLFAAGCW